MTTALPPSLRPILSLHLFGVVLIGMKSDAIWTSAQEKEEVEEEGQTEEGHFWHWPFP